MNGSPASLRARYHAIEARLRSTEAPAQRDALKADIIALYKQADQQALLLAALKDDIKQLVEQWKALPASSAPGFAGARPVLHVDHIGASTYTDKGWSLISLGDYEGAERTLVHALQLAPGDSQAESLLGWAQMLQEKYDEALLHLQRVLMREPLHSLAQVNLGYICLKKHIFGEAIEHLSKAIRTANDRKAMLYAHFYLGLVYLEREMYEDAETFFRKALVLGPNLIEAHYELGRALWFDARPEQALEAWRQGMAVNTLSPWSKRCGEMLRHVEDGGAPSRTS